MDDHLKCTLYNVYGVEVLRAGIYGTTVWENLAGYNIISCQFLLNWNCSYQLYFTALVFIKAVKYN